MVSSMDCWVGKWVDCLVKSLALQQVHYLGQLDGKWVERWAGEMERQGVEMKDLKMEN